jgi:hypothetical protein
LNGWTQMDADERRWTQMTTQKRERSYQKNATLFGLICVHLGSSASIWVMLFNYGWPTFKGCDVRYKFD